MLNTVHERAGLDCIQGVVNVEQGDVSDIVIETVLDAVVVSHCECEGVKNLVVRVRRVEPHCRGFKEALEWGVWSGV